MRKVEDFMNQLTDMDWEWWPLLSSRPPKDHFIDNLVLLKITPFFGFPMGLLPLSILALGGVYSFTLANVVIFILAGFITFSSVTNSRSHTFGTVEPDD